MDDPMLLLTPENIIDLPDDVLGHCFSFLGPGQYRYVAGTCPIFRDAYSRVGFPPRTTWDSAATSPSCVQLCIGENPNPDDEYWNKSVFKAAGGGGHVETLEWAAENGIPWLPLIVVEHAAKCGQVAVLEWVKARTPTFFSGGWNLDSDTARMLSLVVPGFGSNNSVKWLVDTGHKIVVAGGIYGGHLHVLQWALDHGFVPIHADWCACAARFGRLRVLQWLRGRGCFWDGNTIRWAQRNRHSELLDWARENDCPNGNYRLPVALPPNHNA